MCIAAKRNFKKHEHDYLADHGFPYDLMSVMHYRQFAFSKNRKPTILPKRPVPYLRCRGLDCPSEMDIKKINFLYKCHKKDDFGDDSGNEVDSDYENEVSDGTGNRNELDDGFFLPEEQQHKPQVLARRRRHRRHRDFPDYSAEEVDPADHKMYYQLKKPFGSRFTDRERTNNHIHPDSGGLYEEMDDEDAPTLSAGMRHNLFHNHHHAADSWHNRFRSRFLPPSLL